jgi:3-deoxy-D-manno-octulosonate 8-phosphate phosphatase (KDO 8-P phosphatase)
MKELIEKARKIKCFICDVDGVLTNGQLYLDNFGNELKAFHVHDGVGLKLLMAAGLHVSVITTSKNAVIEHRMAQLGIHHYFTGQLEKQAAYQQLKTNLSLNDEDCAYIGDDLPDLPIIKRVGLGIAVNNAQPQVKELASWSTQQIGGHGAVREACDFILNAQNKLDEALTRYLSL